MHNFLIFSGIVAALISTMAMAEPPAANIITYKNRSMGKVEFNHSGHRDKIKNCVICHTKIFSDDRSKNPRLTMKDMENGKGCGVCHNGRASIIVQEDCHACHPTKNIRYEVQDPGNVIFSHSQHSAKLRCEGCHPKIYILEKANPRLTMKDIGQGKGCGACHDGNTSFAADDNCDRCHSEQSADR